jgi:hypothetical protein
MGAAVGWGSLSAFSLVLGALLALARPWPKRLVGLVLAFGAGALISAVSFELAAEGIRVGDRGSTAAGLAVGALVYYMLDGVVARIGSAACGSSREAKKDPAWQSRRGRKSSWSGGASCATKPTGATRSARSLPRLLERRTDHGLRGGAVRGRECLD